MTKIDGFAMSDPKEIKTGDSLDLKYAYPRSYEIDQVSGLADFWPLNLPQLSNDRMSKNHEPINLTKPKSS